MHFISRAVAFIDALNEYIGRALSWLTLGTVLVCFLVVVLRYVFSMGYPWLQELYIWQHACIFMLGAGYTMLHDGHVKVDIFSNKWTPRTRAWVDILCVLVFLFPWLIALAVVSSRFILSSWSILESSPQTDGMQGLFLFKSTIWVFCVLLGLQGLSMIGHRVLFLGSSSTADSSSNAR